MDIPQFQLNTPTRIEFGNGVAADLGKQAATLGMRHALLVTDRGLLDLPACREAQTSLEQAGVAVTVFADVIADPTSSSVVAAAMAYRAAAADGLVALGGGSAMDTAKALGVLVQANADNVVPFFFGGPQPIPGMPPLICLPTTAGTGSEVTWIAVVTHDGVKQVLRDPKIAPALALVDPQLTWSMPPILTCATGMDALSHALETVTSSRPNPYSDLLAYDAIARLGRWLPRAVAHGADETARAEVALAATLAGIAFLNSRLHLGHAVGHSMGTHFKIAHGSACMMCMPALLEFLQADAPAELQRIAAIIGGDDAPTAVARLMDDCAALRLGEAAGVNAADIPRLVEIVQGEQRLIRLSRRAPTREEWGEIFARSL